MLGRILVVENEAVYAEEVCRQLGQLEPEYEVVTFPDRVTAAALKANPVEGKSIILNALRPVLGKKFDVVTINLHLTSDAEDSLLSSGGDWLGVDVLGHITTNYPGICCIVCTAVPHPRDTTLAPYNVFHKVHKAIGPEGFIKELCKAIVEAVDKGHPVKRTIDKRTYEVQGVNSRIYRFLHNKGVMSQICSSQRAFRNIHTLSEYDNSFVKVLSGTRDESLGEAVNLMADLWHLEPGLPRYPLAYKLGKMEYSSTFWEEYRDHLLHQFLVYLLGLYLYYGSDRLRKSLTQHFTEEDFLRAWKIAALFHDLGYVFEVEYQKQGAIYNQVFDELNDFRKRCLYHYSEARGFSILLAEDEKIRSKATIFVSEVDRNQIRTLTSCGREDDLFLAIEPQAQKAHLGLTADSLRQYWEYAMSNWSHDHSRSPYVDHGIAGALVLLQQYQSLRQYVEKAIPLVKSSPSLFSVRTRELLSDQFEGDIANCQPAVVAAAAAIALHNISVDNWNKNDAYSAKSLTLNQFCLSLQETPLAFLLALVDALQMWDRQMHAMPRGPKYVMQSQELDIRFRNGKIEITFVADSDRSAFAQKLNEMSHYMNSNDLTSLLSEA